MTEVDWSTGALVDVGLPVALAIIMLGMGLSLRVQDFRRVIETPKSLMAGLAGQLVLLPLVGMVTVAIFLTWFNLSTALAVGLLLLAACPGGATSNLLTFLGRGDHALSIALTSVISLGAMVLTPGVLFVTTVLLFGDPRIVQIDFLYLAGLVFGIVAGPVLIGMWIRARKPSIHERAEGPLRIASAAFLALVIAALIWENRAVFWDLARLTVPLVFTLNVLALGAGFVVGRAARAPEDQRRCLAFEVGFQNNTLAIVLALTQLGSPDAALVPAFYALVMLTTGAALAGWWARSEPVRSPVKEDVSVDTATGVSEDVASEDSMT